MQNTVKFEQRILIYGIDEPKNDFMKRVETLLAPLTSYSYNHPNPVMYNVYFSNEETNTVLIVAKIKDIDEDMLRGLLRAISEVFIKLTASKNGIKAFETKQGYRQVSEKSIKLFTPFGRPARHVYTDEIETKK